MTNIVKNTSLFLPKERKANTVKEVEQYCKSSMGIIKMLCRTFVFAEGITNESIDNAKKSYVLLEGMLVELVKCIMNSPLGSNHLKNFESSIKPKISIDLSFIDKFSSELTYTVGALYTSKVLARKVDDEKLEHMLHSICNSLLMLDRIKIALTPFR